MQKDQLLWKDRARKFGKTHILKIPMSFKRYELTDLVLLVETGVVSTVEQQVYLQKVSDVTVSKTLFDRIFNTGTLTVERLDDSEGTVYLEHVANPDEVRDIINEAVDTARKANKAAVYENFISDSTED